ncbi:MAG: glycosyltransferase [Acidimicrobiia bacterium]|nr:glycosyltransferase [Acidimicrobiia bacterium]
MDIAVCGAQARFVRGGAELLADNLVAAFQRAGHRAENVRLPVAWDRKRLFDAAAAWRLVPMDYDLAVAINFPAYFVRHQRKVVWLFHQHRAAYDAVEESWSDYQSDESSLLDHRLLAQWDNEALEEATHLYTGSQRVADRLQRYNGLTGVPLLHPSPLAGRMRPVAGGEYVFCATRLEGNKRPELLVEAAARTRSKVPVVIAGHGSQLPELRGLAERLNAPVRFAGHVSEQELIALYEGALAVVYAPFDEDYGYGVLEGFEAGKPVITCDDSGGTLEFVVHEGNGLVALAKPEAVAQAIDRLVEAPEWAQSLGAAGAARVAELSWDPVVEALLL